MQKVEEGACVLWSGAALNREEVITPQQKVSRRVFYQGKKCIVVASPKFGGEADRRGAMLRGLNDEKGFWGGGLEGENTGDAKGQRDSCVSGSGGESCGRNKKEGGLKPTKLLRKRQKNSGVSYRSRWQPGAGRNCEIVKGKSDAWRGVGGKKGRGVVGGGRNGKAEGSELTFHQFC